MLERPDRRMLKCGLAVLVAGLLVAAATQPTPASAEGAECSDGWDDAPASAYCTYAGIKQNNPIDIQADTAGRDTSGTTQVGWKLCTLTNGSCSITVNVGAGDEASATEFAWIPKGIKTDTRVISTIDVCFAAGATSHTVRLALACDDDETDSATAVANGLASQNTGSDDDDGGSETSQ